jgi:hypothetical protein
MKIGNKKHEIFPSVIMIYLLLFSINSFTTTVFKIPVLPPYSDYLLISYMAYKLLFTKHQLNASGTKWLIIITVIMIIQFFSGIVKGNELGYFSNDFKSVTLLLLFIYFGAVLSYWRVYYKYLILIISLGIITTIPDLVNQNASISFLENKEISLSYVMQYSLTPSLLLFFLLITKKKSDYKFIIIAGFVLYLLEQLLFLKRLPLLRSFSVIFMFMFLKSYYNKTASLKILYFPLALIFLLIVSVFISSNLRLYFNETLNRFTKEGSVIETAQNDSRYFIAETVFTDSFKDLNILLLGRGMGGVYKGSGIHGKTIKIENKVLEGVNELEVGQIFILMKYGLIFWAVFNLYILKIILSIKKYQQNNLALACYGYITIWFLFSFGEGFPTMNTPILILLLSICIGFLSSVHSNKLLPNNILAV